MHSTPKDVLDEGLQLRGDSNGGKWRLLSWRGLTHSAGGGRGGNNQNRVSQVFLSYKVPQGIFNIFHKDAWITRKNFCIVFLWKNLLEKHSFGSSTLYLWEYWPCCLLGSGLLWARLTCAHPRIQTDLSMCLQPLGWRHQGHICWEPLELPANKSSKEGERKSTGWPTANSGGVGPLWFRTACSTNCLQPRPAS